MWVLAIVVAAGSGILACALSTPDVAERLLGDSIADAVRSVPPWWNLFGLPLMLPVSAALGFAVPKGFWLWGPLTALARQATAVPGLLYLRSEGLITPADLRWVLANDIVGYFFVFAVLCLLFSALGAGSRLLLRRSRGHSGPPQEGNPA